MPGVLTRDGRVWLADNSRGINGEDVEYHVRLMTDAGDLTDPLAPAGLVEATFGGYADVVGTTGNMSSPALDGDDAVMGLEGSPYIWDCTADPETIVGWYLTNAAQTAIWMYEVYDEPHVLEIGSRHTLYASVKIGQC